MIAALISFSRLNITCIVRCSKWKIVGMCMCGCVTAHACVWAGDVGRWGGVVGSVNINSPNPDLLSEQNANFTPDLQYQCTLSQI